MAKSINLGMPRIGPRRELKRAVEAYWSGAIDAEGLAAVARARRANGWRTQAHAGIDTIPSNDFSLYDQMLDTACVVGALPDRFAFAGDQVDLGTYFALARGRSAVAPLEMTKWFDTNYHYLVPELGPDTGFRLTSDKPVVEFAEALELGVITRPVLIGPVTFLLLSAATAPGFSTLDLLPRLLPVYEEVLTRLAAAGATWVQLDEPCLVTDLTHDAQEALAQAYDSLYRASSARLLLATYFGGLGANLALATSLAVDGLHIDLVRDPNQLAPVIERADEDHVLSLGIVDGRNVWRADTDRALRALGHAHELLGDRLWVGPSCSLQHVPHDVRLEHRLDPALSDRLAFADQKLDEIAMITAALSSGGTQATTSALAGSSAPTPAPVTTPAEAPDSPDEPTNLRSDLATRAEKQRDALRLPVLATTTIGSFPQTAEIREMRRQHQVGELSDADYRRFCETEIERVIRAQEAIGLDVLVHGEPERNDMVQYFAEHLAGFATTAHGWVQSYGTRCVRPPLLFGDVSRPRPITVEWTRHAQSLTALPVKGMLTGPVTILQWSFVRDDQPRATTCQQIALAIRDEVIDLESAGTRIIQVDEPALREGLPLRIAHRDAYLEWATRCFRLATAAADDVTQIHTHMCYADVGDIGDAVAALDADVVSIEASRSGMGVLDDLVNSRVAAAVGPGVYDVHSPRVPSQAEISALLNHALRTVPARQLWVNPDCGLKTRQWDEVTPALANMVAAAHAARDQLGDEG